ncbi:MAG: elongation factor P 5-aminopentanone reductase [Syntrophomonadaceae bacterium]
MAEQVLMEKVCLITGASRGIGAAIARALAKQGIRIAINYLTSEKAALQIQEQLSCQGAEVLAIKADVSQGEDVERMFAIVEERFGHIDFLINNAGISYRGLLTDTTEEQWQKIMDTNLKGPFLCSKRALPAMIRKKSGRIINIASVWGLYGASCECAYAASKGGLISLTKSLAKEVGPSGITVNAIAPGAIATDMLNRELQPKDKEDLVEQIPADRLGFPEEIAGACVFLLSPSAAYINGQVISIDGGWKV